VLTRKLLSSVSIALLAFCCSDGGKKDSDGDSEKSKEIKNTVEEVNGISKISDNDLLDLTQKETFKYFWDFAEPNSGAARERYLPNDPSFDSNIVSLGGTGFGLMGILVGIERGFITREEGLQRLNKIFTFLESADRFHGAWPHWLDGTTGSVLPFSKLDDGGDLVETAFLAQGMICIKEYFKDGNDSEKALAEKADILWKGVEWDWYTQYEKNIYNDYGYCTCFVFHGYDKPEIQPCNGFGILCR